MKLSEIFRRTVAGESAAPNSEIAAPREAAQEQFEPVNASGGTELREGETVNLVGKKRIELKVSDFVAVRPLLPAGYFYPDAEAAARLHAELLRELPSDHPLFGVPLETFAAREGNDNTLFRYRGNPRLFALVHLTGLGATEINEHHPEIVFNGTFEAFVEREKTLYGLEPPA